MALPLLLEILNKIRRLEQEPIGIIRPCATNNVPLGWLECDGEAVSSTQYPGLFSVIGTRFGDGSLDKNSNPTVNGEDFNLPDLRGRFVRGCDNGAGNDPDAGLRGTDTPGANPSVPWLNIHGIGTTGQVTGDFIGSIQNSAFQSHYHFHINGSSATQRGPDGGKPVRAINRGMSQPGRDETRPINVNFMFIVRI